MCVRQEYLFVCHLEKASCSYSLFRGDEAPQLRLLNRKTTTIGKVRSSSVVGLVLNVGDLHVEELGEDLAEDLTKLDGIVGHCGELSVLNQSHQLKPIGIVCVVICGLIGAADLTIKVEDLEALNDNGGSSVETAGEGVDCAANSNDQIIKVALAIKNS